jgi:propanediol utilization protein
MLGYSLDELSPISKDTFVSLSHPDDRELGVVAPAKPDTTSFI